MKRESSSPSSPLLFSSSTYLSLYLALVLFSCIAEGAPSRSSSSSFYDFIFLRYTAPSPAPSPLDSPSHLAPAPRADQLVANQVCNCSSGESCCYWRDRPFCCSDSTTCCGSLCCPSDGVCCRSRTWSGVSSCCSSSQYCTASGDCSVLPINREGDWSMLPLMIGSFVMTFVVCCCTCVCISRINRRRAMLAAAANPGLLGNNPSTNSAYRTFQARGSYSRSQGVTAKTLQTFPTQSYHPGCMPAENAQCSICLLEYEPGDHYRTLPCNHHFHQPCIDRWLSDHDTCPLCVQVVTQSIRIDK